MATATGQDRSFNVDLARLRVEYQNDPNIKELCSVRNCVVIDNSGTPMDRSTSSALCLSGRAQSSRTYFRLGCARELLRLEAESTGLSSAPRYACAERETAVASPGNSKQCRDPKNQDLWVIRQSPHPDEKIAIQPGATIYLEIASRPRLRMQDLRTLENSLPQGSCLDTRGKSDSSTDLLLYGQFPVTCWKVTASEEDIQRVIEIMRNGPKGSFIPASVHPQAPIEGLILEPWQDAFVFEDYKCKDCPPAAGVPVPPVEGLQSADALVALETKGFAAATQESCMATPPEGGEGTVAIQRPAGESMADPRDTTVALVVHRCRPQPCVDCVDGGREDGPIPPEVPAAAIGAAATAATAYMIRRRRPRSDFPAAPTTAASVEPPKSVPRMRVRIDGTERDLP